MGETKELLVKGCGVIILIAVGVTISFAGCYGCHQIHYSSGYRDGTVQKVSDRGVVFKTTEGEMVLGGMTVTEGEGTATFNRQMWYFTIRDPEVKKQVEALKPGQKVRLHYDQRFTPWGPDGDTSYFITAVEELK